MATLSPTSSLRTASGVVFVLCLGFSSWPACNPGTESGADGTRALDAVSDGRVDAVAPTPGNLAGLAAGWVRGDLHSHSTHSADAKKQGGDDVKTCLAIADAYRGSAFLGAYPEAAGNGLDFLAITDHRTDAVLSDPEHKHAHLALIPAELAPSTPTGRDRAERGPSVLATPCVGQ